MVEVSKTHKNARSILDERSKMISNLSEGDLDHVSLLTQHNVILDKKVELY